MEQIDALEGIRRMAFSDIGDAVRLLFCEELPPRVLKSMNLLAVSEIRRPKGGGMEIRFIDRLEAFRLLSELENTGRDADGLLAAVERGAEELRNEEDAP